MKPPSQAEFSAVLESFDSRETMRGKLYNRALALVRAGFRIEAHILILATWNFACFRYAMLNFNLTEFEATLDTISSRIHPLDKKNLMNSDLPEHRELIVDVFNKLAAIGGVKSTGASKVLHLLNPEVFVMWDKYIRASQTEDGAGYFQFLRECQQRFQGLRPPGGNRTMAKCIDEYNYLTITVPAMEKKRSTKASARQVKKAARPMEGFPMNQALPSS